MTNSAAYTLVRYEPPARGGVYSRRATLIRDEKHLREELAALASGPPVFVDLVAPNGDLLTLGVAGSRGSVTFATHKMVEDGWTLDVVGSASASDPAFIEFDVGGTPTPVATKSLVGTADVSAIAAHFLATGDIPRTYEWE